MSDRNRTPKTLRFADIDLDCTAPAQMLDVHSSSAHLDDYSADVNRQLVVSSYATTSFTRNQPQAEAEKDALHAQSFACAGNRRRSARP